MRHFYKSRSQEYTSEEKEDGEDGGRHQSAVLMSTAEGTLVLDHAVDTSVDSGPVASLNFAEQAGKYFADIPLMFRAERGRQFFGRSIPSHRSVGSQMRKETERLPIAVTQDEVGKELFPRKAVGRFNHSMCMGTQRHDSFAVVDEKATETGSILLWQNLGKD